MNFDLQRPQIATDSSDDDDIKMPNNHLIHMYNKEYSILVTETKNFYTQCKESISRLLSINGLGLNMPYLLNKILLMENAAYSPIKTANQGLNWEVKRQKYQQDFHELLSRMGKVIEDLMQFEIDIKLAYFGPGKFTPSKIKRQQSLSFSRGLHSGNTSEHSLNQPSLQDNNGEQMLREILQKGMTPIPDCNQKVCKLQQTPKANLDCLIKKTQKLIEDIKGKRKKQQRIWDIFNEKKPSNNTNWYTSKEDQENGRRDNIQLFGGGLQERQGQFDKKKYWDTVETSLN